MKRRFFLKSSVGVSVTAVAVGAGLVTPTAVLGAWNKKAFQAKKMNDAVKNVFGSDGTPSDKIELKLPEIAENGAVTPVTVDASGLGNVSEIAIFAESNPVPLTSVYKFGELAKPKVSTRIKLAKTTNIFALAKSNGKVYKSHKEVKVTIGGCGG